MFREGTRRRALWVLAGVCGAWAVAADYALLFVVVPMGLFLVSWRRWAWITAGAAPVIGATMAYHQAAFGSALAIGYDLHANFAFARTLSAMFGSNPLQGAWTLFGAGRGVGLVAGAGQGAGLLVMSPITLVGLVALAWSDKRRWLFVFVPWLVLLCFHQTPWGGATADHRYLIPLFPFIAAGLAWLWERGSGKRQMVLRVALVLILCVSTWLVWAHFYHWRSG